MAMDSKPKLVVLVSDAHPGPADMADIESRAEVHYTDAAGLETAIEGAEALLLWDFFSPALKDAWAGADTLRWVHVAAAGVDALLFEDLVRSDVTVTNAHGVFDRPIAEYVLAVLLAQAKTLYEGHELQQGKIWARRQTASITGTKALVVGTGGIGRETARLFSAVGLEVRGVGRTEREHDPDFGTVVASSELSVHAGWADYLVLAAPLTAQTRGMVNAEVLAAMQPTSHLINVGRGQLVDEAALITCLQNGGIAAASLDVFETEPLPESSPLWSLPSVHVSAHLSGDARGWREELAEQFRDNARRWLNGEPLRNVVDKERGYVPG